MCVFLRDFFLSYKSYEKGGSKNLQHKFSVGERKEVRGGGLRTPVRAPPGPARRRNRKIMVQKCVGHPYIRAEACSCSFRSPQEYTCSSPS